jgi:hypothetical protein
VVGDNDGIEGVALRRKPDGTPLLYLLKERLGTTGAQPPVHVFEIAEDPFRLTQRGEVLRLPVALVDQTGAVASNSKLYVVSRFARSLASFTFDGDGFKKRFQVAGYRPLTEGLLGYPKLPAFGMVEGIARTHEGDLFLLADNNGAEIGIPGKNRGREGRLIWLKNLASERVQRQGGRVKLRVLRVPFAGLQGTKTKMTKEVATALAANLRKRVRDGDDMDALAEAHQAAALGKPVTFVVVRIPLKKKPGEKDNRDLPPALARIAFNLSVGDVEVCEYHPKASPLGYYVVQRVE